MFLKMPLCQTRECTKVKCEPDIMQRLEVTVCQTHGDRAVKRNRDISESSLKWRRNSLVPDKLRKERKSN